jgi:hypothetical protein
MSKVVHREFTEELQQLLNKYEVTLSADREGNIDIEDSLFPVQCVATLYEYLQYGWEQRYTTLTIGEVECQA